ncbi:hypothetical protein GIB67_040716 [Kingdonia uniflora]|uniref:MINDY deubiquitinase domain-containing protein n=1 Tax=Kingdonia uniflora TaxID=39325 RepID=A0A7J7KUE6_9MAGN|nr:hypothetical protein GIB67_040716 [Kingdonia uniflora]
MSSTWIINVAGLFVNVCQDHDTAYAVGSKSYNTLMGELVALETKDTEGKLKSNIEEDCIDFAAATAATLGVPSPCLSKAKSFDDSPCSASSHKEGRRGDLEEEAELLRALQISASLDEPLSAENFRLDVSVNTDESTHLKSSEGLGIPPDAKEGHTSDEQNFCQPELLLSHNANESSTCNDNVISLDAGEKESSYSNISSRNNVNHSTDMASEECSDSCNLMEYTRNDMLVQNRNELSLSLDEGSSSEHKDRTCKQDTSTSSVHVPEDSLRGCETIDVSTGVASSLNGNEPIYEGEDRILDSGSTIFESGEPMYEGEMVLAEQADKVIEDVCDVHSKDDVSQQNGDLIRKFLSSNASQLTIYGLFCLQEGLKERELCVFFRNNHFSTLFKASYKLSPFFCFRFCLQFNNELYLLATDQGYLCEPSLVWEKLNEVNGDTVFMTGNFTEFNLENQVKDTWDEQNARTTTADFLASIDNSEPSGSTLTSDMELAIALQQQEFENQPQRVSNTQQSSAFGRSGLVTGPQVSKTNPSNASTTSKHEGKSKEKNNCAVM